MLRFRPVYLLGLNKASETFIADGGAKGLELRRPAFGDEFDAAIGEVTDSAGHRKPGGDRFDGVAESHALHAAGIKNLQATARGGRRAGGRLN